LQKILNTDFKERISIENATNIFTKFDLNTQRRIMRELNQANQLCDWVNAEEAFILLVQVIESLPPV
jgi:sugar/nucleoside kinase (ribokinase family)